MKFSPIGIVRSPFKDQPGTPIQPIYAKGATGRIELLPEFVEALADLDGFERIWVIYHLHKAGPCKLKVVPYRDTRLRGLFSTRAPSRPNPIGLSVVGLLGVKGCIIHVSELDLLDGTPVLDIKPYVPKFDAHPESKAGWLDEIAKAREQADERFEK